MTPLAGQGAGVQGSRAAAWIVGVDIGGTNLRVGAIPAEGGAPVAVLHARMRPGEGAAATARRIGDMVQRVAAQCEGAVAGVGVGVPGPLDRARAVVLETPNLGWSNVPLGALISDATALPVAIANDAACFALGEWWLGAGKGVRRLFGLTLGTGVGGGIVLDGEIYHGASGAAGEIGHAIVKIGGRRCGCGRRGCLEAYASGPAIAKRASAALVRGAGEIDSLLFCSSSSRLTARQICEAARAGDDLAQGVLNEAAAMLAVALTNVIHLLNPDRIVIGGGVANAGPLLLDPLRAGVERMALASAARHCRIVPAALAGAAGMAGAAAVFRQTMGGAL